MFDLVGNVQEWTLGLWRDDRPGRESFVQSGAISIRAIRGLPLAAASAPIQARGCGVPRAAVRDGPCVDKTKLLLAHIGCRCAKWLDS